MTGRRVAQGSEEMGNSNVRIGKGEGVGRKPATRR
jgi:hypothetical protein